MKNKEKTDYDKKIVKYEYVHNIKESDTEKLVNAVKPLPNEKILDAMCGYGSAGKWVLNKEKNIELFLLDNSKVQLDRAKENLPDIPKERFIQASILKTSFKNNFFDKIIIKSGVSDVTKEESILLAREVYRILKPNGRLIIWGGVMNDEIRDFIQKFINKKDEIAGFDDLAKRRYFINESEFFLIFKSAGFKDIIVADSFIFESSTKKRLESEFNSDVKKLDKFNKFVRKEFPENLKKEFNYQDLKDDLIYFNRQKVFVLTK